MNRMRLFTIFPVLAFGISLSKYTNFASAILMIGALIFLHELGHFMAAKWMGLPVEVFSLGFGPRLFGFHWRETDIRLSALPLGGYVKLAGYNPEEPDAEDPHGFLQQPYRRRMLFYSGGVLANVATAFLLLTAVGVDQSRVTAAHPLPSPLLVADVIPGMAAAEAGLQPGDLILSIGDLHFPGNGQDEFRPFVEAHSGQSLDLTLQREGRTRALKIVPRNEGGHGKLGISFGPSQTVLDRRAFQIKDFGRGPLLGALTTADMTVQVLKGLGKLVSFQADVRQLGGPITIVRTANSAARAGWIQFLVFMAFISINLAVINILPIPFLDGGHMAILSFERLRGRDLTIQLKERIFTGGFFLIAALMALVIALDIWKFKH